MQQQVRGVHHRAELLSKRSGSPRLFVIWSAQEATRGGSCEMLSTALKIYREGGVVDTEVSAPELSMIS